ncbi:beta-lactamase/transpeptidase-like protein [Mariannaea sp. PMI_226]|nr:beta-lactamase/transpeptidase-like protein [Mariannaea sp. PMI_226]
MRADENPRILQKFVGNRGIGSLDAFNDDSFIWMASETKIVTIVACLIAVDIDLLSLEDLAEIYVPELSKLEVIYGWEQNPERQGAAILQPAKNKITIRHLLCHTSGLAYLFSSRELQRWAARNGLKHDELSGRLEDSLHPLSFEPGTGWEYGTGVDWAGRIIELVAGCSLEQFCKQHIWDKIGAHNTTFRPLERPDLMSRRLEITKSTHDGAIMFKQHVFPLKPHDDMGGIGLWATPRDFNLFLWHLFLGPTKLLSPRSFSELMSPQVLGLEQISKKMHESTGGILTRIFPKDFPVTPGLGTCITLHDIPGRRPKGTISWVGYPNMHWWYDPSNRIVGSLYMQHIPAGLDVVDVSNLLVNLEMEVYRLVRGADQIATARAASKL